MCAQNFDRAKNLENIGLRKLAKMRFYRHLEEFANTKSLLRNGPTAFLLHIRNVWMVQMCKVKVSF